MATQSGTRAQGGGRRSVEHRASLGAAIVDAASDAITSTTPDGVITSWNRGAELMYGHTAAEAIGRHMSLVARPERPTEMDEIARRVRDGERVVAHETVRRRKDGQLVQVWLSMSPLLGADGRLIGLASIERDISERKRAEQEALATSQYARSLLEASLDPLVTIDPDGRITDVNDATVKVTGVPREQLVGTDFSIYFTDAGKAREGYREPSRAAR